MDYLQEYKRWCTDSVFDDGTRAELSAIKDDPDEIQDRFYKQLSFGTGGLRGVIGAGTNRMNIYTVGKATQGLANYINRNYKDGSVVISFDCRNMSKEFALDTALIMCANGIKAYLFDTLHATPLLSFAVRRLSTTAGIMITASHNPPEYNGYKVYWSDGGQIVSPHDKEIITEVNKINDYSVIKRIGESEALNSGLLQYVGVEIDNDYISTIKKYVLNCDEIKKAANKLKVVYTPLNGTGYIPVTRILKELGFVNVWTVPEQAMPDGNFTTLKSPNPEDKRAFEYALSLAHNIDADIVLATDPDADRLGVYVKDTETNDYIPLTGNMSGLLIADYLLMNRADRDILPKDRRNAAIVTTIVSSKMVYPLAEDYGISVKEVLTGFKFIGEQIKLFEQAQKNNNGIVDCYKGAYNFEFGYEESYGCLIGDFVRDKDAVSTAMTLCEASAYYLNRNKTLWDRMRELYEKYGYYAEDLYSEALQGVDGMHKMDAIMKRLRSQKMSTIGNFAIKKIIDYKTGISLDLVCNKQTKVELPISDVIYYELCDNEWCCVRPSGTEPKIKLYFGVKGASIIDARNRLTELKKSLLKTVFADELR